MSIMTPGAMHHARWMAKVLYAYVSNSGSHQGRRRLEGTCNFCNLKTWITAPSAISAPLNDLQLMNCLLQYATMQQTISTTTIKKLSLHFWCLFDELVGLALFDDRVLSATKRHMVAAMQKKGTCLLYTSDAADE